MTGLIESWRQDGVFRIHCLGCGRDPEIGTVYVENRGLSTFWCRRCLLRHAYEAGKQACISNPPRRAGVMTFTRPLINPYDLWGDDGSFTDEYNSWNSGYEDEVHRMLYDREI